VLLAEQLIGKGIQLRIYDPEVHLSQLLGANRRFIEQHLPHLGSLLCANLDEVVAASDVLVIGMNDRATLDFLETHLTPDKILIDLARIPSERKFDAQVTGLCW
jgi:GDP-mannose 6-dehydrogenase